MQTQIVLAFPAVSFFMVLDWPPHVFTLGFLTHLLEGSLLPAGVNRRYTTPITGRTSGPRRQGAGPGFQESCQVPLTWYGGAGRLHFPEPVRSSLFLRHCLEEAPALCPLSSPRRPSVALALPPDPM